MKKLILTILSICLMLTLAFAVAGCAKDAIAPPDTKIEDKIPKGDSSDPSDPSGGGDNTAPSEELGEENIVTFDNAWDAFTYAKNRFENVETDYVTFLSGVASPSMGGAQSIYSEKYKSSTTNNFLYTTCNYGEAVLGIDPSMAYKAYKEDNSTDAWRACVVYGKHNASSNPNGIKDDFTANYTNAKYINYSDSAAITEAMGNAPTGLSVYVINQDTVEKTEYFNNLEDGSCEFKFVLNSGAHANYKQQVEKFSRQGYKNWKSTNMTFTVDKYGRIKKIECNDKYEVSATLTVTVTANTTEEFYYAYIPDIKMVNGNPEIELLPIKSNTINFMFNGKLVEERKAVFETEIGNFPQIQIGNDNDLIGWFSQPDGKGVEYKPNSVFEGNTDLNLYAYVKANTYNLTFFDGNGQRIGNAIPFKADSVGIRTTTIGSTSAFPDLELGNDYTVEWWTAPNGKGTKVTSATKLGYGNVNVYAYAKYNNFEAKFFNADGSIVDTVQFKAGNTLRGYAPSLVDLGLGSDYDLIGWFTMPNGKGTQVALDSILDYKDIQLYAFVKSNTYMISFFDNENSKITEISLKATKKIGTLLSTIELEIDDNCELVGWFTQPNGKGTQVTADTVMDYENMNLYAFVRVNVFTLTLFNGNGNQFSTRAITAGDKVGQLPTITELGLVGYELVGWFTMPNGGGTQVTADTVMGYGDTNFYAFVRVNVFNLKLFNSNGTLYESRVITATNSIDTLPTDTDLGIATNCELVGWFTQPNGGGTKVTADTVMGYEDMNLYAFVRVNVFSLKLFDANGTLYSESDVTATNSIGALPMATDLDIATNCELVGWFTQPNGGGTKVTADTLMGYEDMNLYAFVRVNVFSLKLFDANGTLYSESDVTATNSIGALPTIANLGLVGHELVGWFTQPNGGGTKVTADTLMGYEDMNLYAYVRVNVFILALFNSNGTPYESRVITAGVEIDELPTITDLGLVGHELVGWFTQPNGKGTKITTDTVLGYENINLYAFVRVNVFNLTLFNGNGNQYSTSTITSNNKIGTLPTATDLGIATNCELVGWFTQPNGGGTKVTADTVMGYEDMNLYAFVRVKVFNITFMTGDETAYSGEFTVNQTVKQAVGTIPTVAITSDENFIGWFTLPNGGGVQVTESTKLTAYEDVTLYAFVRNNNYKIILIKNGVNTVDIIDFKVGKSIGALPTIAALNLYDDSVDLIGWYTLPNGMGTKIANNHVFNEYSNVTLYAYVISNTYELYFDDLDVTVTFKVGETLKEVFTRNKLSNPTAPSGYSFDGWFTQPNGGGTKYSDTTKFSQYSNMTLYPKFKEDSSCVAGGTLVTLADGRQVPVESLTGNEWLLVWNLRTGQFDIAPIVFMEVNGLREYEITHLYFSDGTEVKVIYEHGFWDFDLNRYVYIRSDNAEIYLGHWFNKQIVDESGNLAWIKVQLINVEVYTDITTAWSPGTFEHLSLYVNGMLSMPGCTETLVNTFDVNPETLQYIAEAYLADIEKYGLFTYDEFADLIPIEVFEAFNVKYLKVAMEKGLITWQNIYDLIDLFNRINNG